MNEKEMEVIGHVEGMLENMMENPADVSDAVNKLKSSYGCLTETEQEHIIAFLIHALAGDKRLCFTLLTILVDTNKTEQLMENLAEIAIQRDFTVEELQEILIQFQHKIFTTNGASAKPLYRFYYHFYQKCRDGIGERIAYKKYKERNEKKIVFVTEQLLGEMHSPTQVIVNQKRYFRLAGYDVTVLVVSTGRIRTSDNLWLSYGIYMNNAFTRDVPFEMEYFGEKVTGYNIQLDPEDILSGFQKALALIGEINPAFVIGIGGCNAVADLATEFTTMVSKTLAGGLPITVSKYVMYGSEINTADLVYRGNREIRLLQCRAYSWLKPTAQGDEELIQELREQSSFKAVIVGNRLDEEIREDFVRFLIETAEEIQNLIYVVVGECSQFRSATENLGKDNYFKFTGYVNNLTGLMECCDVFLNPPRDGGGFSAEIALRKEVPILTLRDGDVAQWSGEDFICADLTEMGKQLKKYRDDPMFMEQQKEACRKRHKEKCLPEEQGVENVKRFCEDVTRNILEEEERRDAVV